MRLLHLADLHLGWQPASWPPVRAAQRRERRDGVLQRAVDVALERGVDAVVVAGDLFETFDPPEPLVERALAQLRRLAAAGVLVVTVPGNHDEITYSASVYRRRRDAWPGILVTNPLPELVASVPIGGDTLHLVSLAFTGGVTPARAPLRDFPTVEEPGFRLAAFHGTLGLPGGERSLPLDAAALAAAGYHYVALGHIHQASRTALPAGPAVYPGCLEGKGFDDPGVAHLTLVAWDGRSATVDELPFDVQPIRDAAIDVTQLDDARAIDERIEALADGDAVQRVRLEGGLHLAGFDPAAVQARHEASFFHLEVDDRSTVVAADVLERWAAEPTIRGAFVERMLRRLDEATERGAGVGAGAGAEDGDDGRPAADRAIVERALRYGVGALHARRGDEGGRR